MTDRLNLAWLAIAATVPMGLALLAAWPLWKRRVKDEIGAVAGSAVIMAFSVALIAREFGHILRTSKRCLELGVECHFAPEAFTRYALYAGIGMIQIFAVFVVGLKLEERHRQQNP